MVRAAPQQTIVSLECLLVTSLLRQRVSVIVTRVITIEPIPVLGRGGIIAGAVARGRLPLIVVKQFRRGLVLTLLEQLQRALIAVAP